MKTKAVRMYGAMDVRLEEFELPEIKDDEILVTVSVCQLINYCSRARTIKEHHKI